MKHAYWCVICKTPNCGLIVVNYIGPHDGRPFFTLPEEGPGWWQYECGSCQKDYRYSRDDLQAKALDSPPPPDFRSWW
jgi:hypothetical protein